LVDVDMEVGMKLIPVRIDHRDGVYTMFRTDVGYYSDWKPDIEIPENLWEVYNDFALQAHVWGRIIGRLDNQAYEDWRTSECNGSPHRDV
jgi:hypothetical protein